MEEVWFRSCQSDQEKQEGVPFRGEMTHLRRIIGVLPLGLPLFNHRSPSVQNCLRANRPEGMCAVGLSHPWTPKEGLERRRRPWQVLIWNQLTPTGAVLPTSLPETRRLGPRTESGGALTEGYF